MQGMLIKRELLSYINEMDSYNLYFSNYLCIPNMNLHVFQACMGHKCIQCVWLVKHTSAHRHLLSRYVLTGSEMP
jgi:hypothetical protein